MAVAPSWLQMQYSTTITATAYCFSSIKTEGSITRRRRRRMRMSNKRSLNIYCCRNPTATAFHINCSNSTEDVDDDDDDETEQAAEYYPITMSMTKSKRREVFVQLGVVLFSLPLIAAADSASSSSVLALAAETPLAADDASSQEFRLYLDDVNKFKILIPPDWQVGSGEGDGIKSLTAFYPPDPSVASNVSLVITGLGADFTRLESFGKVDAFAENLIGGLDRSWQRPPGVTAKLVDSKSANGLYYIEYTLQNPGESCKHLFSVLGIANNGWYNRLYTLTGQFVEEEAEKYGPTIKKAVTSFRLI